MGALMTDVPSTDWAEPRRTCPYGCADYVALLDERAALIARAEQVGAAHEETAAKLNTTLHVLGRTMDRAEKAEAETARLREALDACHFYIDASTAELTELGMSRADALFAARRARALTGGDDRG